MNKKEIGLLRKIMNSMSIAAIATTLSACAIFELNNREILFGADDGSQMASPFRLNYAGYFPLQDKLVVYITDEKNPIQWALKDSTGQVVASGVSSVRRENDHASGDSFYIIDFTDFQKIGAGYYLTVNEQDSSPFAISPNPYGDLKYEFFDYFKDHRRIGDIFDRFVDNWSQQSISFNFVADAGDQGYYPVNAAEAQWHLINLLESYPESNEYFNAHSNNMAKVYDELVFMSDPLDKVILPGETLAVAKLHTNSNSTFMKCPGAHGESGPCVSKPETKATYAVARTVAAMARLHRVYGDAGRAQKDYRFAQKALRNAEVTPYTCISWNETGGEGGYYPNNDNWSLWRDPRTHREPCASGPIADPKGNNVDDDHYAALVELYLTAVELGYGDDAKALKNKILSHPHHLRVDKFFWGAVSTEATLSLLTHRPKGMDLTQAEDNVIAYANKVLAYQDVGYPGVTFDTQSNEWNTGDRDEVDNNFRWGSNRMQLNDARILMMAAKLKYESQEYRAAAKYTNGVLRVMDQMFGTNAVALAMFTASAYPAIEHAVTRTHDAKVPDSESGKLVVGPNNWTNSNDRAMPKFGSQPGMKSFALKGTGWASREVYIDGNATLTAVAYFASEIAPKYLAASKRSKP